ncbi:hypothetical protein [uncultured Methanofollis sp.]|uniref:hypothetical protein n=1 Tax=uncultured Methanofollis sp. TaxID=262500 RepID=UPI00261BACF0|nr:hypothetical protein [uncultured Methanofollis sp.]
MNFDSILKEEICRSVVVYFVSFLAIGMLIISKDLPINLGLTFPLAFIVTGAICWFMVRYRRKEQLLDPSPIAILAHALQTRKKPRSHAGITTEVILAILLYLIYLVIAHANPSIPFLWIAVLIIVSGVLIHAIFKVDGEYRVTPVRWAIFYLVLSALFIIRALVLRYPIVPILVVLGIIGVGSVAILLLWMFWIQKNDRLPPRSE